MILVIALAKMDQWSSIVKFFWIEQLKFGFLMEIGMMSSLFETPKRTFKY